MAQVRPRGQRYLWRLSQRGKIQPGYPVLFRNMFWKLPETVTKIDAAYQRQTDNNIIFFTGNQYWVYDGDDFVQGSPRSITDYGFPHDLNKIDAVMIWKKNGKTFFYANWSNFYSSSSSNVSTSAGRLCLSISQNFSLSHTSPVHFSLSHVSSPLLFHSCQSLQTSLSVTRIQSTSLPFLSISPNFPLSHTSPVHFSLSHTSPVHFSLSHVSSPLLFHSCRSLQTSLCHMSPLQTSLSHTSLVHSSSIPVSLSKLLSQSHVFSPLLFHSCRSLQTSLSHTSSVHFYSIPVNLSKLLSQSQVSSPLLFHSYQSLQTSLSVTCIHSTSLPFLSITQNFSLSHVSSPLLFHSCQSLQTSLSATRLQSTSLPFLSISPNFSQSHVSSPLLFHSCQSLQTSLSHTSPVHFSSIPVNLSKLFFVTGIQSTSLPFLSISPNFSQSHVSSPLLFHSFQSLQTSISHTYPVHFSSIPVDHSKLLSVTRLQSTYLPSSIPVNLSKLLSQSHVSSPLLFYSCQSLQTSFSVTRIQVHFSSIPINLSKLPSQLHVSSPLLFHSCQSLQISLFHTSPVHFSSIPVDLSKHLSITRLHMALAKTTYMLFRVGFKRDPIIKIADQTIRWSKMVRYLGVMIDEKQSFLSHMDNVCGRALWTMNGKVSIGQLVAADWEESTTGRRIFQLFPNRQEETTAEEMMSEDEGDVEGDEK
uniref:Uncharacterized protein n=1 Tax=Timema cristinae TaxID=61476 RepID=A0A7R9D8G3_TIMCR|nr:unnamed protein product [Timema cristinae]